MNNTLLNKIWQVYTNVEEWKAYYKIKKISEMLEWIKYTNYKFPYKYYKNKILLDMGCGWGLHSILFSLQGAKEIYALGPDDRVEFFKDLAKNTPKSEKIHVKKMFFDLESEKLIDNKIDIIICNEFIEHLTSEQQIAFFNVSYENLNPNGLLIMHTHNTDNIKVLQKIKLHWSRQEDNIYIKKRREIIFKEFPKFNDEEIINLANSSYGMNYQGILKLCEGYKKTGVIYNPNYRLCAVDPVNGIPDENYISPQIIKNEMEHAGYRTRIKQYTGYQFPQKYISIILNEFPLSIRYLTKSVTFWGRKEDW